LNTTAKYIYGKDVIDFMDFNDPKSKSIVVYIKDSKGQSYLSFEIELEIDGRIGSWLGRQLLFTTFPTETTFNIEDDQDALLKFLYTCKYAKNGKLIEIESRDILSKKVFSKFELYYTSGLIQRISSIRNVGANSIKTIEHYYYNQNSNLVKKVIDTFHNNDKTKLVDAKSIINYKYNPNGQLTNCIEEVIDEKHESHIVSNFKYVNGFSNKIKEIGKIVEGEEQSRIEIEYDLNDRVEVVTIFDLVKKIDSKTKYIRKDKDSLQQ